MEPSSFSQPADEVACTDLICEIYKQFLPSGQPAPEVNAETSLFGANALLDSAALVSLLVEVEQRINDAVGTEILIADDRAMSQTRSPFRTIGTLAEYVVTLLSEDE
jgi:acyl carrier protein